MPAPDDSTVIRRRAGPQWNSRSHHGEMA